MKKFIKLSQPLVSIITPTYNSSNFLEKAIKSVKGQNYSNIEHIIIDGGSTDGTLNIIKKYDSTYNMRWISEKDSGVAEAMNKGFKMAKGQIFAWLDSDNYYNPGIIKKVVDIFFQDSELKIVYGNVSILEGFNKRLYVPIYLTDFNTALLRGCSAIPPQPGVFFKKELFEKVKGFNENYIIACDYDFWLKVLKEKPKMKYLPIVIGNYLLHQKGLSTSFLGGIKGVTETLKIGKKYNQPLSGKLYLFKGYVYIIKRFLINLYRRKK